MAGDVKRITMRVALYTRVSTEDQAREGYSLEVQRTYLLQYAKNFGWDVFAVCRAGMFIWMMVIPAAIWTDRRCRDFCLTRAISSLI